jgi:hypothetical protein
VRASSSNLSDMSQRCGRSVEEPGNRLMRHGSLLEVRGRLRDVLLREFTAHLELDPANAGRIANAVLDRGEAFVRNQPPRNVPDLVSVDTRVLIHWGTVFISAATCARATDLHPEGAGWWRREGAPAFDYLAAGNADKAFVSLAEDLAGPFDVQVDFNDPPSTMIRAVPDLPVGARTVAGDGEGDRAEIEIIERDGHRYAVIVPGTFRNPTDDIWRACWGEAKEITQSDSAAVADCERWLADRGVIVDAIEDGDEYRVVLSDEHGRQLGIRRTHPPIYGALESMAWELGLLALPGSENDP